MGSVNLKTRFYIKYKTSGYSAARDGASKEKLNIFLISHIRLKAKVKLLQGWRYKTQIYNSKRPNDLTVYFSYLFPGGESCDEMDEYATLNGDAGVAGGGNSLPIRKRAKWRWLNSRSSVASRWTWLTAQISDLEYRIRQQVRTCEPEKEIV
jgi:hypothetical protein